MRDGPHRLPQAPRYLRAIRRAVRTTCASVARRQSGWEPSGVAQRRACTLPTRDRRQGGVTTPSGRLKRYAALSTGLAACQQRPACLCRFTASYGHCPDKADAICHLWRQAAHASANGNKLPDAKGGWHDMPSRDHPPLQNSRAGSGIPGLAGLPTHAGGVAERPMDRTRQPRRWRLLGRGLAADLVLCCIYRCGRSLALSQQQFQLLQLLSDVDGGVLTYPDLAHAIWGIAGRGSVALLRKLVRDLWREIEPDPKQPMYILCVAGPAIGLIGHGTDGDAGG